MLVWECSIRSRLVSEEAVAYERGTLRAKTTKLSVLPVDHYEADEIREIRKSTGFTQAVFAQYMGVSVKTVEAWGKLEETTRKGLPAASWPDSKRPCLPHQNGDRSSVIG